MLTRKIGLEFEFITFSHKKDSIVFPGEYEFSTDEFIILGEERTLPHTNMPNLMGDFYAKWYKLQNKLIENNLYLDTKGYVNITPEFYAEILRKMGGKEISTCENLYKTDILKMSDAIVKDGKIESYYITTGLHLHFSLVDEQIIKKDIFVKKGELWEKTGTENCSYNQNVLPIEWMKKIIRAYDKNWLGTLTKGFPTLKFRQPGFYEKKAWGFEYRSLPFSKLTMEHLPQIISDGFKLLEQVKFI